jgi:lysozyme family protein
MELINIIKEGIEIMVNFVCINFFLFTLSSPFYEKFSQDESSFKEAIYFVLQEEGGLANHKDDKGGITNYGISIQFVKNLIKNNPHLIDEFDLNNNKKIDSFDIINISKEEAKYIYKRFWWDKYNYGKINYQPLANKIFDMAINMGPVAAASLLEKAYRKLKKGNLIDISYILDESIINNINSLSIKQKIELLDNLRKFSINYYMRVAESNPSQKKFLKGWLKRANK